MIQQRLKIARMGRIVEVALCLVAVLAMLVVLSFCARLLWWVVDSHYHLFSK